MSQRLEEPPGRVERQARTQVLAADPGLGTFAVRALRITLTLGVILVLVLAMTGR